MHRATRMEVSLQNIVSNFHAIRTHVGPSPEIFAVVKADAYGHGAVPVASALIGGGCRRFAVAIPDEAFELREGGITAPVLVLGPSPERSAREYVRHGITSAVTDLTFARALSAEAVKAGIRAKVHVKVDTGMGRIGFLPRDIPEVLDELSLLPGITIEGMFTHFAVADEARLEYTAHQFDGLTRSLEAAEKKGFPIPLRHACNSAGVLACPEKYLDGVRPGIILYGMWPSQECPRSIELLPTFEVKTEIAFVKDLPAGSGVGYGLRYMTRGMERIAVLPVGYADGYSRALSMRLDVLIGGKRVPHSGNICMDQTMVNVTGMDVKVGDEVVLLGRQGDEVITPEEIGALRNTLNYEVPIMFLKRVPRVYIS
ncbi:MAG: alanine racemase [Synergistaceae bacterium]|nr:alanine racemase [Synergistaceae bacterium]